VWAKTTNDTRAKGKTDTLLTDLVLHFIKNLQQGDSRFDYDKISINHDSLYISQLLKPRYFQSVSKLIALLDCKDHDYKVYKMFLKDSLSSVDSLKRKTIVRAMNYRRFINTNCQSEFLVVNSAQTEAEYYKGGRLAIKMRVIVGKKTKQTPTIASYITSITTFPNWNVPHQIAVDEILPKVQKDDNYLEQNNYEVVDANGNEIDDSALNWNDVNKNNFTLFFRQSSGSANALGVVKFNLQDTFSIFLHGTSNQKTFSKDFRFLSHGCVRLEKPFELADSLLRGKIDIKELETGATDKEPNVTMLHDKLPTFIIYMPVKIDNGNVTFLKDEYDLIK
jgi:murein L,D-transpeptidase YcbB/YkuD